MPVWSKAPKSVHIGAAALRRSFRKPSGGLLCFAQGDVLNFSGDALATSTSNALEGIRRADWWGFAGCQSADAALHMKIGGLVEECRKQTVQLEFGEVLVTRGTSQVAKTDRCCPDPSRSFLVCPWPFYGIVRGSKVVVSCSVIIEGYKWFWVNTNDHHITTCKVNISTTLILFFSGHD